MKGSMQIWDGVRAFFSGTKTPIRESVAMLVLISFFSASDLEKTLLPFFLSLGHLLTIPSTNLFRRREAKINKVLFWSCIISALGFCSAAFVNSSLLFLLSAALPALSQCAIAPTVAQMYGKYDSVNRGARFSSSAVAFFLGSLFFAWCARELVKEDISSYPLVMLLYAAAYTIAAFSSLQLPSESIQGESKQTLFSNMALLWQDRLFGYICLAWFINGTAYHWLAPYRTNFLVEEEFGFSYSPGLVLLTVVIIPNAALLLSLPLMGLLFDKINFISHRIINILLFMLYAYFFFYGESLASHIAGMVFFGVSFAATSISWTLWVTKLAPAEHVSSYMAVHTTLTGIRMTLAPLIGLWALKYFGAQECALASLIAFAVVIIMLIPILKLGKTRFNW